MEAHLVRAFLDGLPAGRPDDRGLSRVRFALASLQSPDVRYLVARVSGPQAAGIARVARAVLLAAGARTGVLGQDLEHIEVDGRPIDDPLIGVAGTLAISSAYQLGTTEQTLGELRRRELAVILGLVSFAESGQRVALLLDDPPDPLDPVHAPRADLVVLGPAAREAVRSAIAVLPDGVPVVVAPLPDEDAVIVRELCEARSIQAMVGGRDYRVAELGDSVELVVRGEPYVRLASVPGTGANVLATGIAAALGLGVMGIRMREDWVRAGIASLRAVPAAT